MTSLMIRIAMLTTCSIALIAAFSVTPVVAAGSDPGGGEANYGGMNQRSASPPSSYPKQSGTKATHGPTAIGKNTRCLTQPIDRPRSWVGNPQQACSGLGELLFCKSATELV